MLRCRAACFVSDYDYRFSNFMYATTGFLSGNCKGPYTRAFLANNTADLPLFWEAANYRRVGAAVNYSTQPAAGSWRWAHGTGGNYVCADGHAGWLRNQIVGAPDRVTTWPTDWVESMAFHRCDNNNFDSWVMGRPC
jgi:hypothetical protein